ncbi:DUF4433 domain-containing protein [Agrobacterium sp. S2]|nr:DUF4433 domain-containing protein [Agrobacterium sp. S2]
MALRDDFVREHIARWQQNLQSQNRPYREKWPSRLFHHAPIENAVKILKDGFLRSRNDTTQLRVRDVAAPGVIDSRTHTHDFGRLYFRPRTPTQWHIEGIRKTGECAYGDQTHAPLLVMMIFDAWSVLRRPGVHFCDRNTQLASAVLGDSEAHFNSIPFEKVYHEGYLDGDRSIIEHRCAEVLAVSPMPLSETMQWIYCRTDAERATLLHMLGGDGDKWANYIKISDDLLVFERKYAFCENVSIDKTGLVVKFNPRQDRQAIDVKVYATNSKGERKIRFHNPSMSARPNLPSTSWRFKGDLENGPYAVEIQIEGHIAFQSTMIVGQNIFL